MASFTSTKFDPNIRVIFEFGMKINISQKGKTPKLVHKYMFSNVKKFWNWINI